jgi:hypothetical protein
MFRFFVFFLIAGSNLLAQPIIPDWPYSRHYRDDKLFLHTLRNYDLPPWWYSEREKRQYSENQLNLSFGSIEDNKLFTNMRSRINLPLNETVTFRLEQDWYAAQHIDNDIEEMYLGLDFSVLDWLAAFASFDPAFNKDEVDFYYGLHFSADSGYTYLRLGLLNLDFVYTDRNGYNAEQTQDANGLRWRGRFANGPFVIYSEGRWTQSFARQFNDSSRTGHLQRETGYDNRARLHAYWYFQPEHFFQLGFWAYQFSHSRSFTDPAADFAYKNDIRQLYGRYIIRLNDHHRLRFGLDLLVQEAAANGRYNYDYRRRDLMPSGFYEYLWGRHGLELGLVATDWNYDWQQQPGSGIAAPPTSTRESDDRREQKVKLAYTHRFSRQSQLQVSLSHVLSYSGFGGANIQYIVFF